MFSKAVSQATIIYVSKLQNSWDCRSREPVVGDADNCKEKAKCSLKFLRASRKSVLCQNVDS